MSAAGPARLIHHITTPDDWAAAQASGVVAPPSLDDEGFVHLSTAAQVDGVLARFYAGRDDLLLLDVDPVRLDAAGVELRWEAPAHPDGSSNTDGESADRYPHAYAPLPIDAVVAVRPLPPVARAHPTA